VLGKAALAGVYDVRVAVTEMPTPSTSAFTPLTANVTVRVNVSCAAAEAMLDSGADVAHLEAHVTFEGISSAALSTSPGAASHLAALEQALTEALGLPPNSTSATGTTGDDSRATVAARLPVPASMIGGSDKAAHVTLDAGHIAENGTPRSSSQFSIAAAHAGRTLSRLVNMCCNATAVEL